MTGSCRKLQMLTSVQTVSILEVEEFSKREYIGEGSDKRHLEEVSEGRITQNKGPQTRECLEYCRNS